MAMKGEYALSAGTHIKAMEYLTHAHGNKSHGHTVRRYTARKSKRSHLHAVTDDIGDNGYTRYERPLIRHVEEGSAREDAVCRLTGRTVHGVGLCLLHSKGKGGKTVCDKVDKEQVHGIKQSKAHKGGNENAQHLAHIGRQ